MIRTVCVTVFLVSILSLSGCGETFRGVKEDSRRIGKGVKDIFVSE